MPFQIWEDFRGGTFGTLGGTDAKEAQWFGSNAQVYENGTLGVRPGWKSMSNAGTLNAGGSDTPLGVLFRVESADNDETGRLLLLYDASGTPTYEEGTIAAGTITWGGQITRANHATNDYGFYLGYGDTELMHTYHDGLEMVIIAGEVWTDYSGTSSHPNTSDGYPRGATAYRDRMYYWGFASAPGTIHYSDPADYSTIAGDFDISYDSTLDSAGVIGCWAVRNTLLIARRDGTWVLMQGFSPSDGTLTELGQYRVPQPGMAAVVMDNQLYWLSRDGRGLNIGSPGVIDSESLEFLKPVAQPEAPATVMQQNLRPVVDQDNRRMFFPARYTRNATQTDVASLEIVNDTWVTSDWQTPATTDTEGLDFSGGLNGRIFAGYRDGTDWEFHSRDFTLNRPARSTGEDWSVSADTEGYDNAKVEMPEVQAEPGLQIRPLRLIVDFDYWNAANFDTPGITANVDVLGVAGATDTEQTVAWSAEVASATEGEPTWETSSGVAPLRRTVQHFFGLGVWGSSIRVEFQFNGVAIRRVMVEYEERNMTRVA